MSTIKHIAIIPDGNRRWAKKNNKQTVQGHEEGFQRLREILQHCHDLGPTVLSFYAFSTENFRRSKEEVQGLMSLLERVLEKFSKELKANKVQLRISGSRDNLSPSLLEKLDKVCQENSTGEFILNICFNYGAQEELTQACQHIAQQVQDQQLSIDQINTDTIQSHLWNSDLPPVDLMIRTSGELRISNFLLWQCAYAELYFSQKLWPDFYAEDLKEALDSFDQRQRRYGS